jgi:hypothetical protein
MIYSYLLLAGATTVAAVTGASSHQLPFQDKPLHTLSEIVSHATSKTSVTTGSFTNIKLKSSKGGVRTDKRSLKGGKGKKEAYGGIKFYEDDACTTPAVISATRANTCLAAEDDFGNTFSYYLKVKDSKKKSVPKVEEYLYSGEGCDKKNQVSKVDIVDMFGFSSFDECIGGFSVVYLEDAPDADGFLISSYFDDATCSDNDAVSQIFYYNGGCFSDEGSTSSFRFNTDDCSTTGKLMTVTLDGMMVVLYP